MTEQNEHLFSEPSSEVFRIQITKLAEAIQPNFDRILDKFHSNSILSDTFIDDVTSIQGDSTYKKASKVVHELHRQIASREDSDQYLNNICEVLLREENQTLRSIATHIRRDVIFGGFILLLLFLVYPLG